MGSSELNGDKRASSRNARKDCDFCAARPCKSALDPHRSMTMQRFTQAMAPWSGAVQVAVSADVTRLRAAQASRTKEQQQVAEALFDLMERPAKRIRPVLMAVVAEAYGQRWSPALASLAVALEWMQVYLLVHDDWMDHDLVRRGGPSVPAQMAAQFPLDADAVSVLAGDLARAYADEALASALDAGAPSTVVRVFAEMHRDVVLGQLSDVLGSAKSAADIETLYAQKTASYTTWGPVRLGAVCAGLDAQRLEVLSSWGMHLGIAFQLRDDIRGVASDIRERKQTWMVRHMLDAKPTLRADWSSPSGARDDSGAWMKRLTEVDAELHASNKIAEHLRAAAKSMPTELAGPLWDAFNDYLRGHTS